MVVKENIRAFVGRGGGYVGICAGMSIATRGYWDFEGWVPDDPSERHDQEFPHFTGMFPHEVENLHGARRVDLDWNLDLPETHPIRVLGHVAGARYNDGNSVLPGLPGTEYLLRYCNDEPWDEDLSKGSLSGKWATIAYIDPDNPSSGRLVLHGWHPESARTPQCHSWFRWAVEYAAHRTTELNEKKPS